MPVGDEKEHFQRAKPHLLDRCAQTKKIAASFLLVFIIAVMAGCSGGKDKKEMADALGKNLRRDTLTLFAPVGRVGDSCGNISAFVFTKDLPSQIAYHSLQKAGVFAITPDGPAFWNVELVNPPAKLAEHLKTTNHNTKNGCNAVNLSFPVAYKSLIDIKNINRITDQTAEVEYTWKWTLDVAGTKMVDNLTTAELGQANGELEDHHFHHGVQPTFSLTNMSQSSVPQAGKKILKKSGDSWVVNE